MTAGRVTQAAGAQGLGHGAPTACPEWLPSEKTPPSCMCDTGSEEGTWRGPDAGSWGAMASQEALLVLGLAQVARILTNVSRRSTRAVEPQGPEMWRRSHVEHKPVVNECSEAVTVS